MLRVLSQEHRGQLQGEAAGQAGEEWVASPFAQPEWLAGAIESVGQEYFGEELPGVAAKVRDLALGMLRLECPLPLLRQIMADLRNQADLLRTCHQCAHGMLTLQTAPASPRFQKQGEQQREARQVEEEADFKREGRLKEEARDQETQREGEGEAITEKTVKTMHSEIIEADHSLALPGAGPSQLLGASSVGEGREAEGELEEFERRGRCVLANNIEALMLFELEADLRRQVGRETGEGRHAQVEECRYNRLIKDALMNGKLRQRRRKQ